MANRRRVQRREPRYSAPASDCLVKRLIDGKETVIGSFTPKPREERRRKVVMLPSGKAILRLTDL
jgi:hypothetical protein